MSEQAIWSEKLEVRTHETDLYGHCKPAAYYRVMEEATVHHSRHLQVDFFRLQEYGLAWVLARSKTRFFHFPPAGTTLIVKTWPKGWSQKIFGMREYSIATATGRVCALATSAWLLIDTSKRQFVKPERLPLNLPDNDGLSALDETLEKLAHPAEMNTAAEFQARYSSLDLMEHVNNAQYVDWIFDSLPLDFLAEHQPAWLQINFNNEVKHGENVAIEMAALPDSAQVYAIRGLNRVNESIAFDAHLGFDARSE